MAPHSSVSLALCLADSRCIWECYMIEKDKHTYSGKNKKAEMRKDQSRLKRKYRKISNSLDILYLYQTNTFPKEKISSLCAAQPFFVKPNSQETVLAHYSQYRKYLLRDCNICAPLQHIPGPNPCISHLYFKTENSLPLCFTRIQ